MDLAGASDELGAIADELYALPPSEFTAARTAHEKAAKSAGNRGLAAEIHALGKPTAAAWLANQLVRRYPDEIKPLLQLGAGLREATATLQGEQLRELGRQQYKLISALVQQARKLGGPVSADTSRALESTLRAALADEAAAEQLSAGRLTEALERTGFPAAGGSTSPSRPVASVTGPARKAPAPSTSAADKRLKAALDRAEHEEQQAKFAAHKAADTHKHAQAEADEAEEALAEATAETDQLRRDLDLAITEQARLERHLGTLSTALKKAARANQQADEELEDATRRRRELASGS